MCGIFLALSKKSIEKEKFNSSLKRIEHRGPDNLSSIYDSFDDNNIAMGHARLSIIDLNNTANQPFEIDQYRIIFNGEVYNYRELRDDLIKGGYSFKTNGDTEVLLASYIAHGTKFLDKVNGMFAFAILDKKKNCLVFGRDRAGVKPLYLHASNDFFILSSELSPIEHFLGASLSINKTAVASYYKYGYIPGPLSIYNDVAKVVPGTIGVVKLTNYEQEEFRYWSITNSQRPSADLTYPEYEEKLESLIVQSVRSRLVADVPVGLFLSGGYDSSLIAAVLAKDLQHEISTYTIGFEDKRFDESSNAQLIATHLGLNNTTHFLSKDEFISQLDKYATYIDEPIADMSIVPTLAVSQLAAKDVKVVLSADGGDEMFGGYDKYQSILNVYKYRYFFKFLGRNLPKLHKVIRGMNPDLERKVNKVLSIGDDWSFGSIFESAVSIFNEIEFKEYFNLNPVSGVGAFAGINANFDAYYKNGMLVSDYLTYQADNILHKVDRMTMRASIEGREPLLDYRLTEFALSMPFEFKMHKAERKILLKNILHKRIPKQLMDQRKRGFGAPLVDWLLQDRKELILDLLSDLKQNDMYKLHPIQNLQNAVMHNDSFDHQKLWSIVMLESWKSSRNK